MRAQRAVSAGLRPTTIKCLINELALLMNLVRPSALN
jgi:hypothetical protein